MMTVRGIGRNKRKTHVDIVMYGARVCNGSCVYCCNRLNGNLEEHTDEIKIDYEALEKKIYEYTKTPERIQIWGTEPLLHWKEFKDIVEFAERRIKPRTIGTSSNGILLCNKEIADYLIDHKIRVQLSWDGLGQKYRTKYDFIDNENITRLAKEKLLNVNCVLHGMNTDVKGNIEYFEAWEKRIGTKVSIRFSLLMAGDNGEYAYKYPNLFLKECKKYINHRYFYHEIDRIKKFKLDCKPSGCYKYALDHEYNYAIDTLGNYCPCNLLDSSQKPANPEGKRLEECDTCIYKNTQFCNSCVSLPLEKKCVWNKAYNNFLIAMHSKLIKYEQQGKQTTVRMASSS